MEAHGVTLSWLTFLFPSVTGPLQVRLLLPLSLRGRGKGGVGGRVGSGPLRPSY